MAMKALAKKTREAGICSVRVLEMCWMEGGRGTKEEGNAAVQGEG